MTKEQLLYKRAEQVADEMLAQYPNKDIHDVLTWAFLRGFGEGGNYEHLKQTSYMDIGLQEEILNDESCAPYVDKGRKYVNVEFADGVSWGYEKAREKGALWLYLWMTGIKTTDSFDEAIESFNRVMDK